VCGLPAFEYSDRIADVPSEIRTKQIPKQTYSVTEIQYIRFISAHEAGVGEANDSHSTGQDLDERLETVNIISAMNSRTIK
jgi:hypothetical protein